MDLFNQYVIDFVKDRVSKSNLLKDRFKKDVMEKHSKDMSNIKETEKYLEKKVQLVIKEIDSMENGIVELEFDIRTKKMKMR